MLSTRSNVQFSGGDTAGLYEKELNVGVSGAERGMKALPECGQNHAVEVIGVWKHGVPGLQKLQDLQWCSLPIVTMAEDMPKPALTASRFYKELGYDTLELRG